MYPSYGINLAIMNVLLLTSKSKLMKINKLIASLEREREREGYFI